jgi:hypothetical protein
MFKEVATKRKWDDIHNKIRYHNKNYIEFDSLETHNDLLPRDKILREEALNRYIKTKSIQVGKELMENAEK